MGRVLGSNVENGGRSSDHVNVLDAIRAVEDCALRGAGGGGFELGNGHGHGHGHGHAGQHTHGGSGDWADLARFLYGTGFDVDASLPPTNNHLGQDEGEGWNAPLDDYDSIPAFPVQIFHGNDINEDNTDGVKDYATDDINGSDEMNKPTGTGTTDAGNATTPTTTAASTAPAAIATIGDDKSEKEAATKSTSKRKREDESDEPSDHKRVKSDSDENYKEEANANEEEESKNNITSLPSYIPNFLPPFPPKHTYAKSSRPVSTPMESFPAQDVRSSLVQLGHSYWGAMTPTSATGGTERRDDPRGVFVKVNTAPVALNGVAGVGTGAGGVEVKDGVKPVVRASNARISRILEGSMDVHS